MEKLNKVEVTRDIRLDVKIIKVQIHVNINDKTEMN